MPGEESALSLKDVAGLIPSVYYDLISRVCAGVPFVLAFLYCLESGSKVWELENHLGKSGVALLLLLVGYVAGLLLSSISYLIEIPLDWWVWRKFGKPKQTYREFDSQRWSQMDQIIIKDKEMGATLVKMMAETALCENLLAGLLILLVCAYSYGQLFEWKQLVVPSLLLVSLIWAVCHRAMVTHYRQEKITEQLLPGSAKKT